MRENQSGIELAERTAKRLLCPSHVCEVSLRNGWPQIHFEHDGTSVETSLWIDSSWRVEPAASPSDSWSPEQVALLSLGAVAGAQVEDVKCLADGGLIIHLNNQRRIVIDGIPQELDIAEPWILSEIRTDGASKAAKIVAIAREGFAVWCSEEPYCVTAS
jgi:hypothetical protein